MTLLCPIIVAISWAAPDSTGGQQMLTAAVPETASVATTSLVSPETPTSQPVSTQTASLTTIEGDRIEGEWLGIEGQRVRLGVSGRVREFDLDDLMLIQWSQSGNASRDPSGIIALLHDGSRLHGAIGGGGEKALTLLAEGFGRIELPFRQIRLLKLAPDTVDDAERAIDAALAKPDPAHDRLVYVRDQNVTTVPGVVVAIDENGGSFLWRSRRIPIDPEQAYAIIFAHDQESARVLPATCALTSGSVVSGTLVGGSAGRIRIERRGSDPLELPIDAVESIRVHSQRVQYLDELQPVDYRFEPFGITEWPYRMNRSVTNRPLRVGDRTFERGIGMHSQSELTFETTEPFSKLAATIGIDEAAGAGGNVQFQILGDGKLLYESGPVTGDDQPLDILVQLAGTRRITLRVTYGENLDAGDQADWADIRLIR